MTAIALKTAGRIEVVQSWQQFTLPPDEALTAGVAARGDASTGKATKANGTTSDEAAMIGIVTSPSAANIGVTLLRKGIVDGYDLSGLDYGDLVYLSDTDGRLDTAAGAVPVVIGRVIRGSAAVGGGGNKLLLVDVQTVGTIDLTSLEIATGDTLNVVDADGLTVNDVIVPQHLEVSFNALAAAALVDQSFFIANRAYEVVAVKEVHATAESTAATLRVQVTKDTSTNAPGAGANLLTNNSNAGFDLKATANTVQSGTLTATGADLILAAGDRLSVDFSAAATEGAGVTITVSLKRV
jgi:hypothetical protein